MVLTWYQGLDLTNKFSFSFCVCFYFAYGCARPTLGSMFMSKLAREKGDVEVRVCEIDIYCEFDIQPIKPTACLTKA